MAVQRGRAQTGNRTLSSIHSKTSVENGIQREAEDTAFELPDIPGLGGNVVVATIVLNVLCLALPLVVLQVYDRVLPNAALDTLLLLAIGLAGVMVMEGVLRWARAYLVAWNGVRFQHDATCKTVDRLLGCDLASFEHESLGTHLNRLQAVDQLAESVSGEARLVVIDLCFVLVFLFVFWTIAGSLVAVPLILLAITAIIALFLVRELRQSLGKKLCSRGSGARASSTKFSAAWRP